MSKKNKLLMISPSGNFYGSEQVLFDYLQKTTRTWTVDIPAKGKFSIKSQELTGKHQVRFYNNKFIKFYFIKLFFQLIAGRFNVVCSNEAGFVRYLILLAKIFTRIKFVIHVRLLEDTDLSRWHFLNLPKNISVISISDFISNNLKIKTDVLYDLYPFNFQEYERKLKNTFEIGIIGRVTLSKGIDLLPGIIADFKKKKRDINIKINLFGDISEDTPLFLLEQLKEFQEVVFHGFLANKEEVYENLNAVLHLNQNEPLGRIYLEAIDYCIPFIGIHSGGIGEIGKLTGADLLLAKDHSDLKGSLCDLIIFVHENYNDACNIMVKAKKNALKYFSEDQYVKSFEDIIFK